MVDKIAFKEHGVKPTQTPYFREYSSIFKSKKQGAFGWKVWSADRSQSD